MRKSAPLHGRASPGAVFEDSRCNADKRELQNTQPTTLDLLDCNSDWLRKRREEARMVNTQRVLRRSGTKVECKTAACLLHYCACLQLFARLECGGGHRRESEGAREDYGLLAARPTSYRLAVMRACKLTRQRGKGRERERKSILLGGFREGTPRSRSAGPDRPTGSRSALLHLTLSLARAKHFPSAVLCLQPAVSPSRFSGASEILGRHGSVLDERKIAIDRTRNCSALVEPEVDRRQVNVTSRK